MKLIETDFADLFIFEPTIHKDERGYFFESYNLNKLKNKGIDTIFIQDNQSKSKYGTIRGLHYQLAPYAQTKLIRVLHGTIKDIVVDIRKNSSTFGKHFSIELSSKNQRQLYIPKGFAHGFSVLSETAEILYKCDSIYHPESERGILYTDTNLALDWNVPAEKAIVSQKDKLLPSFNEAEMNFTL